MDEPLLWVNLRKSNNFAGWLVRYPQIAEHMMSTLATFNTIQSATLVFDLMACRDAAQALHMAAREDGLDDMAAIFSGWYDDFCRALLYCLLKMNEMSE